MFGQILEQFFERTIRELVESEEALRQLARNAGAGASMILARAEHLRQASASLNEACDHLAHAAKLGQTRVKTFIEEFEYVQECLWSFYRHFQIATLGQ